MSPERATKSRNSLPLSKKGKDTIHSKRRLLVDADGWTHVISRLSSLGLREDSIGRLPPVSADMTVDDISREHQQHTKQWQRSGAYVELKTRLTGAGEDNNYGAATGNRGPDDKPSISNIVCLGLGSLQGLSSQLRQTSHTQLAALETVRSALGLSSLRVIMQDPHFTALDKDFLASLGFVLADDPDAFAHIGEGSLVFALHCSSSIYGRIAERPRPAVLVGNDIKKIVFKEPWLRGVLESLVRQCDEITFPQLRTYFNDTPFFKDGELRFGVTMHKASEHLPELIPSINLTSSNAFTLGISQIASFATTHVISTL